jgi:hypothetical protein
MRGNMHEALPPLSPNWVVWANVSSPGVYLAFFRQKSGPRIATRQLVTNQHEQQTQMISPCSVVVVRPVWGPSNHVVVQQEERAPP